MKNIIIIFSLSLLFISCKESVTEPDTKVKIDDGGILVPKEIIPGIYTSPENLGTFSGKFLKPNDLAPDFLWNKGLDTELSLSDLRGKVVYIEFWRTRCSFCRSSLPILVSKYNSINDKDFVVVTVTSDIREDVDLETVSKFIDDFKMDKWVNIYDNVSGDNSIFSNYNIFGTPNGFLISKTGKIVEQIHPSNSNFESLVITELAK